MASPPSRAGGVRDAHAQRDFGPDPSRAVVHGDALRPEHPAALFHPHRAGKDRPLRREQQCRRVGPGGDVAEAHADVAPHPDLLESDARLQTRPFGDTLRRLHAHRPRQCEKARAALELQPRPLRTPWGPRTTPGVKTATRRRVSSTTRAPSATFVPSEMRTRPVATTMPAASVVISAAVIVMLAPAAAAVPPADSARHSTASRAAVEARRRTGSSTPGRSAPAAAAR